MGNSESISYMPSLAQKQTPRSPWPLAVVLATADSASRSEPIPVVTYQHVGNGRVVVIEGAGMWRWAFLSPRNQADDEVYGRLWRSMLRWLVANVRLLPSQPLRLSTDKVTCLSKENVVAELLLRQETVGDKVPVVELHGPGLIDVPRTVIPTPSGDYPGQFRVPFGSLPEGRYRAQVVGADPSDAAAIVAFDVRENLQERLDVTARPDTLRLLADKSNGALFEQLSPQLLAKRFEAHLDRVRPERIVRTSAWDRWWVLIATLAVCSVTWGMRRWSGLV